MHVDRNIKVPDLILSSKTDIGLNVFFFAKKSLFMNFVTLIIGVALHFSLQLANPKLQRSDFVAVCKANNST